MHRQPRAEKKILGAPVRQSTVVAPTLESERLEPKWLRSVVVVVIDAILT